MSAKKVEEIASSIRWHISRRRKFLAKQEMRADLDENKKIFIGEEYAFIRSVEDLLEELKRLFDANIGKMPPQENELEKAVLGAVICHKGCLEQVSFILRPEHFYREAHSVAYRTLLKIAHQEPDLRSIVQQARKDGVLDAIGGVAYLAELESCAVNPFRVGNDALVLIEFSMRRRFLEMAQDVMIDGYDDTVDVFDLEKKLKSTLEEVTAWRKEAKK
jgi:replicative DNA helicase